jgi:hypothetical protein
MVDFLRGHTSGFMRSTIVPRVMNHVGVGHVGSPQSASMQKHQRRARALVCDASRPCGIIKKAAVLPQPFPFPNALATVR